MGQSERLRNAVRIELTRMWRNPTGDLAVLTGNGVLMTVLWFALPRTWFFTFTGPSGYALALAGWMYADVTATNILGADRHRILALLDDPGALRTVIRAKEIALWLIVAPMCSIVAIACGFVEHDWRYTVLVVAAVSVVPIGALAITGLVGVMFPYHQVPLMWRWKERRRFRPVIFRWMVLVLIPYLLYPLATAAIYAIPIAIALLVHDTDPTERIPTGVFGLCLLLSAAISVACWWWANRFALNWIERHRVALHDYLSDLERG